jgi:hypothetical protein
MDDGRWEVLGRPADFCDDEGGRGEMNPKISEGAERKKVESTT